MQTLRLLPQEVGAPRRHRRRMLALCCLGLLALTACNEKEIEVSAVSGALQFSAADFRPFEGRASFIEVPKSSVKIEPERSSVSWTQLELLDIALAAGAWQWAPPILKTEIRVILFDFVCDSGVELTGPTRFGVQSFQEDSRRAWRTERNVTVYLDQSALFWSEREVRPSLQGGGGRYLDLSSIKIPMERALAIVEAEGGRALRLAKRNRCEVSGSIVGDLRNSNWSITYYVDGRFLLFEIDKVTGAVISKVEK